jgi:LPS-assembly lipoprotein
MRCLACPDARRLRVPPSRVGGAAVQNALYRCLTRIGHGNPVAAVQLLAEGQEQEILSLSPGGRVRELQLRYRLRYQVIDKNRAIIAPITDLVLRRDFSLNDQDLRGIDTEQALLFRDMQTDAAYQVLRRLQAAMRAAKKT